MSFVANFPLFPISIISSAHPSTGPQTIAIQYSNRRYCNTVSVVTNIPPLPTPDDEPVLYCTVLHCTSSFSPSILQQCIWSYCIYRSCIPTVYIHTKFLRSTVCDQLFLLRICSTRASKIHHHHHVINTLAFLLYQHITQQATLHTSTLQCATTLLEYTCSSLVIINVIFITVSLTHRHSHTHSTSEGISKS